MSAIDFVTDFASRGRYHFTTDEAVEAMNLPLGAVRAALRRLKRKGVLAAPHRGFYVIVPPEYRRLGCLPAEQFVPQLMGQLGLEYYAGLLSAAQYYGAAHQQPQIFQVVVAKNRPAIACGEVRVEFVARRNVSEIPRTPFNTARGEIAVSSLEATAFDLVGYSARAGGLGNVATVLAELADSLDPERLVELVPLSPIPWAQRLGFLLSLVGARDRSERLAHYVEHSAREFVPLEPGRGVSDAPRDARWKLMLNVEVEPDL